MAFDEQLGHRISNLLERRSVKFDEKRMFGGLGFMINDKMCVGIVKDELMLRVLDEKYEHVLAKPNVRKMDFTGRSMRGFVYIDGGGFQTDEQLDEWLDLAVEFGKLGIVKGKKK